MKRLLLMTLILFCIAGCKEYVNAPFVENNIKPKPVRNIKVENIAGGAKVTYSLPDDQEALYVEAKYNTKGKGNRIVKSSVYKNYIILNGFFDTEEKEVELYVVNRSQKRSDPTKVTIQPLEAPIHFMFNSIQVKTDFGGINMKFTNPTKNEYEIHTLVKDSLGEWQTYDINYTSVKDVNFSVHGLPAKETEFAFFVRDEWQNYSDTLLKTLTPIFEEKLDKSLWKAYPLANDSYKPLYSTRRPELMWDNSYTTSPYTTDPTLVTLPQWFTIDLGKPAKFSRGNVQGFSTESNHSRVFSRETPKVYEIWGSNHPNPNGDWADWTLLIRNTSVKPSGSPIGSNTADDLTAAIEGDKFTFPFIDQSYRYIRFKTVETWGNQNSVMLGELTLWGQAQ